MRDAPVLVVEIRDDPATARGSGFAPRRRTGPNAGRGRRSARSLPRRRGRAERVVMGGVSWSHMPVSQTRTTSALQLVLVRLDPFGQELRAVLLRALDQERDADRQLAGHRLPGPAGLDEGHHLPLVVAGAARGDHLAAVGQGRDPAARRAASPTGRAGRPAARRNGRRTARAACPPAFAWPSTTGWPPVSRSDASTPSPRARASATRPALRQSSL